MLTKKDKKAKTGGSEDDEKEQSVLTGLSIKEVSDLSKNVRSSRPINVQTKVCSISRLDFFHLTFLGDKEWISLYLSSFCWQMTRSSLQCQVSNSWLIWFLNRQWGSVQYQVSGGVQFSSISPLPSEVLYVLWAPFWFLKLMYSYVIGISTRSITFKQILFHT